MKTFLEDTIIEAGKIALDWFNRRDDMSIETKASVKDVVSDADFAVEDFIKSKLNEHFPDVGFFGEESGETIKGESRLIVDPIDGTLSFIRGHLQWSISIALEVNGQLEIGAVYGPAVSNLYLAEKGRGTTKNGNKIQVSTVDQIQHSVIATGFACVRANLENNNLPRFDQIALQVRGMRVLGSAALDLCMVAEGSLDAFFEQNLNLYDVAAGALIVEEAGGRVSDFQNNPKLDPEYILATNNRLHKKLLELM